MGIFVKKEVETEDGTMYIAPKKSLDLNEVLKSDDKTVDDDMSVSASSSANFSFGTLDPKADAYPALYNPEKQEEYEQKKKAEAEANSPYGMLCSGFASIQETISSYIGSPTNGDSNYGSGDTSRQTTQENGNNNKDMVTNIVEKIKATLENNKTGAGTTSGSDNSSGGKQDPSAMVASIVEQIKATMGKNGQNDGNSSSQGQQGNSDMVSGIVEQVKAALNKDGKESSGKTSTNQGNDDMSAKISMIMDQVKAALAKNGATSK